MPINGMRDELLVFEGGKLSKSKINWYAKLVESDEETHRFLKSEFGDIDISKYPDGAVSWSVEIAYSQKFGHFAEFMDVNAMIYCVLVPDEADWPDFFVRYIKPHIELAYQEDIRDHAERTAETLSSYVRLGQGDHIDKHTGKSVYERKR